MKHLTFFLKSSFIFLLVHQTITQAYAQEQPDLLPCDSAYFANIPTLVLTPESSQLPLPNSVDNTIFPYFPRRDGSEELYMYNQNGLTSSCQSVATVFFTFTYEINRLRNVESDTQATRYAPNFVWNHINHGNLHGYTSLDTPQTFLKKYGAMSDWDFDGPAQLNALDYLRWPTGYDLYYNALRNKLNTNYKIVINQDGTGLEVLKHYLYDHDEGSNIGGVVTFGAKDYGIDMVKLIEPSAFAGEQVRYKMRDNHFHGHAVTIVGYNDSVMYDWGGAGTYGNPMPDGEYSNTRDNNLDDTLDMRDWEIGALKVADNYGPLSDNEGFEWVLYCCLPTYNDVHRNEFHVLQPFNEYSPEVVLKVKIEHGKRDDLILGCGYALKANAVTYIHDTLFTGYNLSGGPYPMQGADLNGNLINGPIELLFDFSCHYSTIDFGKVFLINENHGELPGTIYSYSMIDYRWNEVFELQFPLTNFPIGEPSVCGINYDLIPHENDIESDLVLNSDMVSRFNPTVSNESTLTIEEDVQVDMYNSEITINPGSSLILEDNVTILAKKGICKIHIDGNIMIGDNVHFIAENNAQLWIEFYNSQTEIDINNLYCQNTAIIAMNDRMSITNSTLDNSAVYGFKGTFDISGCNFYSSIAHFANAASFNETVTVDEGCVFTDMAMGYAIEIDNYPNFRIEDCSISGCYGAISMYNSGYGTQYQKIAGNEFFENSGTGILICRSSADLYHNTIESNNVGIMSYDRSILHVEGNSNYVTQIIKDNNSFELIATDGSFPEYFHWNLIQDDDNQFGDPLIKYSGFDEGLNVQNNCWGRDFDPYEDLEPSACYLWEPVWDCILGGGIYFSSEDESLYISALNEIDSGNYSSAKTNFQNIVALYPSSKYAQASLKQLFNIEEFVEDDYSSLKDYFSTDSSIIANDELFRLAEFLSNFCEIKLQNWTTAINWFEDIISDPLTLEDSVFAIIDLNYTYYLMNENGTKSYHLNDPGGLSLNSFYEFKAYRDSLLSLLPGKSSIAVKDDPKQSVVNGQLIQNMPNPFNGETQLLYEVYRESHIRISICNCFGQELFIIDEGLKDKGTYDLRINAQDFTPGLFFYSLYIDGMLTDTKKMMVAD